MSIPELSAILFSLASSMIIVFHLLLALGAPLGERAMGGKYPGKWPKYLRIIAILIICFWVSLSLLVMNQADLIFEEYQESLEPFGWFVTAFCGLQVGLHAVTPSPKERQIWLPVTITLLVTSLIVLLM